MSYNHIFLFDDISIHLERKPRTTLNNLSKELGVSRRTIQYVISLRTGKGFNDFRDQALVARVKHLFVSQPGLAIKEISFAVGYRSACSFARAVKRASGISPVQLRSRLA